MKHKTSITKRILALFLTFTVLLPTVTPYNNLWANNNGPNAPEAASFEPVDAADMVNLATGDLSYVLPLLNVPSPEGGYPVALAYHAGIAMDQEASWTGLGWNINPGAINRYVAGAPDDVKRNRTINLSYNKGGVAENYGIGASIGWGEGLFSAGLYASYSTHKTFGGETTHSWDYGVTGSVGIPSKSGESILGINGRVGTDGYSAGVSFRDRIEGYSLSLNIGSNGIYAGVGFGLGKKSSNSIGLSLGYDYDGGMNGGMSVYDSNTGKDGKQNPAQKAIGINFSSKGIGFSSLGSPVGSISFQNSGSSSGACTDNTAFVIPIPIGVFSLNLSYSRQRYWYFKTSYNEVVGSLYTSEIDDYILDSQFSDLIAYDMYESSKYGSNESKRLNPTFSSVSYDNYSVNSQGLSGSIKPSLERGYLHSHKKTKGYSYTKAKNLNGVNFNKDLNNLQGSSINSIPFYFENEFSSYLNKNYYEWDTSLIEVGGTLKYNYDSDIQKLNTSGYSSSQGRKKSGTYIETYTNNQLKENTNLVIKPNNFNRNSNLVPDEGIGAYKITAIDGKVYHYTIPVYQREKFTKTTSIDDNIDISFYQTIDKEPYATHWLLTAITGPDYVDVNNNNEVDASDYGYWVNFNYGKWSDGYGWRTPRVGTKNGEESKTYQWGVKDVYYLDAINTRTHTALFYKDIRSDDVSPTIRLPRKTYELNYDRSSWILGEDDKVYHSSFLDEFSFTHLQQHIFADPSYYLTQNLTLEASVDSHRSLYLKKIVLVKNQNSTSNVEVSNSPFTSNSFSGSIYLRNQANVRNGHSDGFSLADYDNVDINRTWSGEYFNNVLDMSDYSDSIEQRALSVSEFDYDYSLANGAGGISDLGRLTLKSLTNKGKAAKQVKPPYTFQYFNSYNYDSDKEDNWGYYKDVPENWSLKSIKDPLGGKIEIQYESDDVHQEIVDINSGGGVKKLFTKNLSVKISSVNGHIALVIENRPDIDQEDKVDFTDYFTVGDDKPVNIIDFMADVSHFYSNDIFDWVDDCDYRQGRVSMNDAVARVFLVESGTAGRLILYDVNDEWSTVKHNDGWNWLTNKEMWIGKKMNGLGNDPTVSKTFGGTVPRNCKATYATLFYSISSNLFPINEEEKIGGGVRVKELIVTDSQDQNYSKKYFYNSNDSTLENQDLDYVSSGVTSYIPRKYDVYLKYGELLPAPSVMYKKVRVVSSDSDDSAITNEYIFETLEREESSDSEINFNSLKVNQEQNAVSSSDSRLGLSKYVVRDYSSKIGRLLSKSNYNSQGQLLSKTVNEYEPPNDEGQGVFAETFYNLKHIYTYPSTNNYSYEISSKVNYPNVIKSTSVLGFDSGIRTKIDYVKYDYLTGQATETHSFSSTGMELKTESIPAFRVYPEMGSKAEDIDNKNMLSQGAQTLSYFKSSTDTNWQRVGAEIHTWQNWGNDIWRRHKTYAWKVDLEENGSYKDFVPFAWGNDVQDSGWQKLSEITKYSDYSRPLETMDINGNKASNKMGYKAPGGGYYPTKVIATCNSGYNEMYYSGAESTTAVVFEFDGGVRSSGLDSNGDDGVGVGITNDKAHTGYISVRVGSTLNSFQVTMKNGEHRAGTYKVSVWVDKGNEDDARVFINNQIKPFNGEKITAGDWVLLNHYEELSSGEEIIGVRNAQTSGWFYADDFRLHPVESSMTSYVYNEWDELECILGPNNMGTKFEYDPAGRLIKTFTEVAKNSTTEGGFKKVSANGYNYKKQ